MAACRSSSENIGKMSLIPVFNKNLPQAHTESEFDVLCVHRKLVKYVVTYPKKKLKKNYFSSYKLPKQQSTNFWSQGILGVNVLDTKELSVKYSKESTKTLCLLKTENKVVEVG
jgi:hypothetical protein